MGYLLLESDMKLSLLWMKMGYCWQTKLFEQGTFLRIPKKYGACQCLNHHKPTYGYYGGRKRDLFKDVPLTPAPMMNRKGFSAGNTNQFSVGDMTDEE